MSLIYQNDQLSAVHSLIRLSFRTFIQLLVELDEKLF